MNAVKCSALDSARADPEPVEGSKMFVSLGQLAQAALVAEQDFALPRHDPDPGNRQIADLLQHPAKPAAIRLPDGEQELVIVPAR